MGEVPGPFQSQLMSCPASLGLGIVARRALAMLVAPASRWTLMAKLRIVAKTCAALTVRIWERSSSKVTSRHSSPNPVQPVLDAPVPSDVVGQLFWVGLICR